MIEIIEAQERLVRLQKKDRFSGEPIFGTTPTYWCAACDDITAFKLNWRKPFEPSAIEDEFNKAMGKLTAWEQDYCNFHCRICRVRNVLISLLPKNHLPISARAANKCRLGAQKPPHAFYRPCAWC